MSFTNPPTSFIQEYGATVQMMAQQMESKLAGAVRTEVANGERFYFELYNQNGAMRQVTNRFQEIQQNDTVFERRAVDLLDYDFSQLVDSFDKLKMLIDPTSSIIQAQAAQVNRQRDDIIIRSLFSDMKTGKTGATPSALPAGQVVAVNSWAYGTGSGNANMTISKLIEAMTLLDNADVDANDRYLVIDPINHAKLLATSEATSAEFVTSRSLETGKVDGLCNFKFIVSTRLPVDGSNFRRCFAWHKSGVGLAVAQQPKFDVSIRNDIASLPYQAYLSMSMEGTRLENSKVVEIKCVAT